MLTTTVAVHLPVATHSIACYLLISWLLCDVLERRLLSYSTPRS